MNISEASLSQHLKECIGLAYQNDLNQFFNSIRAQEHATIPSLTDRGLTQYQARVRLIDEMEYLFLEINKNNR